MFLEVVIESGIIEEIWDRGVNTAYQIVSFPFILCSCSSWFFARIRGLWWSLLQIYTSWLWKIMKEKSNINCQFTQWSNRTCSKLHDLYETLVWIMWHNNLPVSDYWLAFLYENDKLEFTIVSLSKNKKLFSHLCSCKRHSEQIWIKNNQRCLSVLTWDTET